MRSRSSVVTSLVLAIAPVLIACGAAPAGAQDAEARAEAEVDAFVRSQIAARRIPGASVAVVKHAEVVLARGYGLANVEHQVPATEHTLFQLASITKQFTATAVMMLVEDGRLTLETPLGAVLDGMPSAWQAVTVAQLLTHTSGIPSYTDVPAFRPQMRKDVTPSDLIDIVREVPMNFAPGEKYRYNNTGYVLLGMVVEKLSGTTWGAFLDARIFAPAGMATARVNDHGAVVPHRAQGYVWTGGELRNGEYLSPTQPYAAGALLVSVLDLVRWEQVLARRPLLSASSQSAMYAPAPLADGTVHPYGFGWHVEPYRTRPRHAHGGGIPGFSTYYARYPEDGVSVIVLSNGGTGAESIADGIAAVFIPALREHAPRPMQDSDPATTAFLRSVVLSMARGEGEAAWFTPEQQAFFFPDRIREGVHRIGAYGPLRTFELMDESASPTGRVRTYRAGFDVVGLRCTFTLTPDGAIAGVGLRLE